MAASDVQAVLGRAVADSEFRKLLSENAEEALKDFDLTEEEMEGLKTLDTEKVSVLAESLDERITKGFAMI